MGKINIGAELNPIYGRIGSAAHIYDYENKRNQGLINTKLLNEVYSYDLGLKTHTILNAGEGAVCIVEYKGGDKYVAQISWDITRKHEFNDFELSPRTCPDGLFLEIDNMGESEMTDLDATNLWSRKGQTRLLAGKGVTTATMKLNLIENYSVEATASFYNLPPIYYGFSDLEEIPNPAEIFENQKRVQPTPSGRYRITNETGKDGYFYICIPHVVRDLGFEEIEVTSSGFFVPFVKVLSENTPSTGLDNYDCWRNPIGSMIWCGNEIIYDVK